MKFPHDCAACRPLGEFREFDLYYCDGVLPTVVARYGADGSEYTSGMLPNLPELVEARIRARAAGYIRASVNEGEQRK